MCTVTNYVYYVLLDFSLTEFVMNESMTTSSKGHEKNDFFMLIGMEKQVAFFIILNVFLNEHN